MYLDGMFTSDENADKYIEWKANSGNSMKGGLYAIDINKKCYRNVFLYHVIISWKTITCRPQ